MKHRFTQHWIHSAELARHAWRFYFLRPDATVSEMSRPSYDAWIACHSVYSDLPDSDRDIIRAYHGTKDPPVVIAEQRAVTVSAVMDTVKKSWRLWAVKRGLADDEITQPDNNNAVNKIGDDANDG